MYFRMNTRRSQKQRLLDTLTISKERVCTSSLNFIMSSKGMYFPWKKDQCNFNYPSAYRTCRCLCVRNSEGWRHGTRGSDHSRTEGYRETEDSRICRAWNDSSEIIFKIQESPPAWTQEAYRPPCSEYSFCCPILADPPPSWLTHPPPAGWPTNPPPLGWPPGWLTPPLAGWPPPRLTDPPSPTHLWLADPPPGWPPPADWPPPP